MDYNEDTFATIGDSVDDFNILKDYLHNQGFERENLEHLVKAQYGNTIDMFILHLFGAKIEVTCLIEYKTGEFFYEYVCYKNENDIFMDGMRPEISYSVEVVMEWIKNQIKKIVSAENAKN